MISSQLQHQWNEKKYNVIPLEHANGSWWNLESKKTFPAPEKVCCNINEFFNGKAENEWWILLNLVESQQM